MPVSRTLTLALTALALVSATPAATGWGLRNWVLTGGAVGAGVVLVLLNGRRRGRGREFEDRF
ncbi:hypothetical protein ABT160_15415 [Streptomyces sp. NPDC001941]|uniref:hypothetical protein n=1 Tax=Streptomyces sp. NPDC001941 TaxID=3154659 RepID=UPI00331CE514